MGTGSKEDGYSGMGLAEGAVKSTYEISKIHMKRRKTRYKSQVRIDPKQLIYLGTNKDCKTKAGYLDKMINHCRKCKDWLERPGHNGP